MKAIQKPLKGRVAWKKKILHIDMDAFYAAIEQRDHPEYRGKPVVVGGNPQSRGVVSTCSYEARIFGIHSAMPAAQAHKLCPTAIFLRPHFEKYREVSQHIMAILRQHTVMVESVSLDEAYLDVTEHRFGIEDPVIIASLIKQTIHAVTQLTASAGVPSNLFLAKIASDIKKPDGLTVVFPDQAELFLKDLSVRKIPGVGPKLETQLKEMDIYTCGQLRELSQSLLIKRFGKTGLFLWRRARGEDFREVEPYTLSKQYSSEETFSKDTKDVKWLLEKLKGLSVEIFKGLQQEGRMGRTVVLKVKYHDFDLITRSKTLPTFPQNASEVYVVAKKLLSEKTLAGEKAIRLIGLGISGLTDPTEKMQDTQKELFNEGV